MLQPGDPLPAFSLESDTGEAVTNETLRGSRAVLFFYPKDHTSG